MILCYIDLQSPGKGGCLLFSGLHIFKAYCVLIDKTFFGVVFILMGMTGTFFYILFFKNSPEKDPRSKKKIKLGLKTQKQQFLSHSDYIFQDSYFFLPCLIIKIPFSTTETMI